MSQLLTGSVIFLSLWTSVSFADPALRVLPRKFHTALVLNSDQLKPYKVSYFVTMAVDTDANKIAMELHHPFKEVGHIWTLCDFNTGDVFVAWLDRGA